MSFGWGWALLGGVEKLWGGDFLARGGIPGCALRNGPLFSGSLRNSVSAMPFPFLAFVAFGTRKGLLCLSLKKVDSQQRVNNGVFTHPETVQLL